MDKELDTAHIPTEEEVSKISMFLFWINDNLCFRFNVSLSRIIKDKQVSYYSEVVYRSNNPSKGEYSCNIKLNPDVFITLETVKYIPSESVMIKPFELFKLLNILKEMVNNYYDNRDKYFYYDAKFGKKRSTSISYELNDLPGGSRIILSYDVNENDPNEDTNECICIGLLKSGHMSLISIEMAEFIYHTLYHMDLYQMALSMITYHGKPNIGTNTYNITSDVNPLESTVKGGKTGRTIIPSTTNKPKKIERPRSFFNTTKRRDNSE